MKYEELEGVRRSDLWLMHISPYHFKYRIDHPQEQTPTLALGSMIHKYILEPDTFFDEYAIAPEVDRRTKAGKEEYNAFVESLGDKEAVSVTDYEVAKEMAAAIPDEVRELFKGKKEEPIVWTDPQTGEICKCRADVIGDGIIVDYKTTTSCQDGHFERSCKAYGYKFQAGMYCEGMFQNTLEDYGFVFVAQEKAAPYAVRVYYCDKDFIREGQEQFREFINLFHECKQKGEWPGYTSTELLADGE